VSELGPEPRASDVPGGALVALVAVAIVGSAFVLYGSAAAVAGAGPREEALSGRSVAIVVCVGLLGALPHVLWSLSVSIGCRELRWRALLGYLVSLPLSVVLAAALAFDAELLSGDPYGLAALAATAGFLAIPAGRTLLRLATLKRAAS
jgi:hypothetical protein